MNDAQLNISILYNHPIKLPTDKRMYCSCSSSSSSSREREDWFEIEIETIAWNSWETGHWLWISQWLDSDLFPM